MKAKKIVLLIALGVLLAGFLLWQWGPRWAPKHSICRMGN